jgi:hypothetical protein
VLDLSLLIISFFNGKQQTKAIQMPKKASKRETLLHRR